MIPLLGALVLLLTPRVSSASAGGIASFFAPLTFGIACAVLFTFDRDVAGPQFTERHQWARDVGLEWTLRIDGISLWLVMLTAVLFMIGIIVATFRLPENPGPYLGLLLMAEAALMGLWLSGNLLLFYVFWEAMLIPFYFLLGMWGSEGRRAAVTRFVIYTMVGSLLMLVAIVATGVLAARITGQFTFDIEELRGVIFTETQSTWLFAAFAVAFLIKLPLWPFHAWLPGAYRVAPILVTGLLAAVMSKAGAYGFLRIGLPLFPDGAAAAQLILVVLSVISIVYGSLVAWRAPTMRMVVAYSSLAHLGFIALGIITVDNQAATGAVLQMVNHGLVVAAAFAVVGIITHRTGREGVDELGGLAKGAPWFTGVFLLVAMASLAIPGSNAFIGEFFILNGTLRHHWWAVVLACLGTVYASVYMLRLYQRAMNGPVGSASGTQVEMKGRDWVALFPLVAGMLAIALWPQGIVQTSERSVDRAIAPAQVALDRPADQIRASYDRNPPQEATPLPGDPAPEPPPGAPPQGAPTP